MRFLVVPVLLALVLLGPGCEEEPLVTQDIVSTIPWPDHERAEYVLLDRDGERERGRGILETTLRGETYQLSLRFDDGENMDTSLVTVNATTLKPLTVERNIRGEEDASFEATYNAAEEVIQITETTGGNAREIPRRLKKEHYYDNESSLFLWRTVDFREGFGAAYYTVLANQGGVERAVRLHVAGKEGVTVPAGTFEAWRVEVRSGGLRQIVWYADTPERTLVQYDNSRDLLQLTSIE